MWSWASFLIGVAAGSALALGGALIGYLMARPPARSPYIDEAEVERLIGKKLVAGKTYYTSRDRYPPFTETKDG